MPLIQGKSKKAFNKNVGTEMKSGKPQDQALAIAYAIKRKNRKKMAQGGQVNESAKTEHRPMPQEKDKDSKMVSQNSMKKAPAMGDSMKQDDISYQAKKGMRTTAIKHPRMVASDVLSARLRDEEDDLMSSASPGPYGQQPPKHDDEEGANRHGRDVPDMQEEHSTRRKPYAKGGQVEQSDYRAAPNKYEDDLQDLDPSEDEGSQMAHEDNEEGPNRQGPGIPDQEEDHSERSLQFKDSRANEDHEMDLNPAHDKHSADDSEDQPEHEEEMEHASSIAAAIMSKERREKLNSGSPDMDEAEMYAEGGEIASHESIYSDDSDQADLSRNADEDANEEDQLSFNALRKENYSESEGLDELDSPMDSAQHGDEEESESENTRSRNIADKIRMQMKKRSPMTR